MSSGKNRPRYAWRRGGAALALALTALVALEAAAPTQEAAAEEARPRVVAAGVTAGGVDLSGLGAARAERKLEASHARPLAVVFRGRTWRFAPQTLGASTDFEGVARAALAAGPGAIVPLDVSVNEKRLKRWANRFAADFDTKPRNSRIVLRGERPRVTPSRLGQKVFVSSLRTAVTSALRANDRGPVQLRVKILRPRVTKTNAGPAIVILRGSNRLTLYRGSGRKGMRVQRKFTVATGRWTNPTPLGSFTIVDKQRDPWWYPPDSDWAAGAEPVPPGPGNPLGTRWMGLSEPLIGIHGTPDAASIGYSASRGCIRMLVPEAEWLFEQVDEGTPVFILDA